MSRSLILFLALCALGLAACQSPCGGGGAPYAKVTWPFEFGQQPAMVPGPQRLLVTETREVELGVIDNGAARCQPASRIGGYRVVAPGQ